jgi:hypothetical protein
MVENGAVRSQARGGGGVPRRGHPRSRFRAERPTELDQLPLGQGGDRRAGGRGGVEEHCQRNPVGVLTSVRVRCTIAIVKVIPPGCRDDIRVGFGSTRLAVDIKSASKGLFEVRERDHRLRTMRGAISVVSREINVRGAPVAVREGDARCASMALSHLSLSLSLFSRCTSR